MPVLWFCASTCFQFWSKTFTKGCTNNSLLSCDKRIFWLLELTGHVLSISENVWKNIDCFRFREKLTQSVAQVTKYHVSDFLSLHFAVDQVLSILRYDLENRRIWCKQKFCMKNMTVKIPILILFHFCLICVLSLL